MLLCIGIGPPERWAVLPSTLYNLRDRLSKHHVESGENLLEKVFEQITDPQIQDLAVHTRMQRMDPAIVASNIVKTSQLEGLVTALLGRKPAAENLHLSDFEIKQTEIGQPTPITCPQAQNAKVQSSSWKKRFVAHFDEGRCRPCPSSKPGTRDPRAAEETPVRQVKNPLPGRETTRPGSVQSPPEGD